MNSRFLRVTLVFAALLVLALGGYAQETTKKRWHAATFDGTSGLFKVYDAETLRQGETNFTFGYDQFHRDPGQLMIGRAPAGAAVGVLDRFELFGSMDVQRHIEADNIRIYRRLPGQLPTPAQTPPGVQYFSQAAPFIDVPDATGRSDIHLGLKFNILSERKGSGVSIGVAGFGTIPGQQNATGLNRGLSSGSYQAGFAFLLSKTAAKLVRFHMNFGANFYTDPEADGVTLTTLQDEFIYRGGIEVPAFQRVRAIVELNGIKYFGDPLSGLSVNPLNYTGATGLNPSSPVDLIFGLRVFPREWIAIGGGYQMTLNNDNNNRLIGAFGTGTNGFVVQGSIGTRRNDPPTVTCSVAKNSILQLDNTTVRANAVDPDGDKLTYTWTSSGGKIEGNGDTAKFDATGVAPGKYIVSVTVSDGKKGHEASCSSEITVLKRNYAPTATVEPSTFNITQGDSVNLKCNGSDQNNDPLTYSWTVDGQNLAAAGPQISFGSEGRKPGSYKVTCTVSDGEASGSGSAAGTVKERVIPNQPPTIDCLTTTMDVASGGTIELRAKAADRDGDKLNYSWTSTGGSVSGSGETATFNASGVKAGSYSVTATVDDGRGGKASCSMTVNVSERISVTKEKCGYFTAGGARVDNCAKAILDDLAVRMKNDPKLRANIIGYTDDSNAEKRVKGLGEKRAKAVSDYLQKQGVEASRLTVTDGGPNNPVGDNKKAAGRTLNRRVEIELSVR
jgi:outer membrane protein OmpA-like peptidoglycan-associated protein